MTTTTTTTPPPPPQPFEVTVARKLDSLSSSLLETFLKLDVDRDGFVTRSDLKVALHNVLGIDLDQEQMDAVFVRFAYFDPLLQEEQDSDKELIHHGIRYQEFVRYMDATARQRLDMSIPKDGSTLLDTNQDETVDADELLPIVPSPDMERSENRKVLLQLLKSHSQNSASGGMETTTLFLQMDTHRSGRVVPQEFCEWVNERIDHKHMTPTLMEELLGPDLFKSEGMTHEDFVHVMKDLESDGMELGKVDNMPFEDHQDETSQNDKDEELARQHYQDALQDCVDNGKSDVELIQGIASQLFVQRVKLMDAFRKHDIGGTGRLNAEELSQALSEFADLHVSVNRAQSLVDKFDVDGDGRLSKGEFVRLIASSSQPPSQQTTTRQESETRTTTTTTTNNDSETTTVTEVLRRSLVASVVGHEEEQEQVELANRLDEEDIELLLSFRQALQDERIKASKIFASMDKDHSKTLSQEELLQGFEQVGVHVSEEHIAHIMKRFETDGTGRMKYHQFVKLISSNLSLEP